MYINWLINYILVGFIFQWLMYWGAIKITPQYSFNHKERIALIFIWPVGVLGFIYSFIRSFLNKNE